MIEFEKAVTTILKHTPVLNPEKILIENSTGRILQEHIYSTLSMPPFDKSAVDGYAVISEDVKNSPVILKCIGTIRAGAFSKVIHHGECIKIMTGAQIPKNADSVVMVEDTGEFTRGYVKILKSVDKNENICFQGEDIKTGQKVLKKGMLISASHIALLAAVGKQFVNVSKKPTVAILNTGNEIVSVGRTLRENKIYNSNGPMLESLLKSDSIEPHCAGIVHDNVVQLRESIKKILKVNDMVLISGGVSMGDYDFIPDVLRSLGVRIVFHKVKIKPGKPLLFGTKGNKLIFGVPGNPVSAFLCYLVFIRTALSKMMNYPFCKPQFKSGILEKEFRQKPGRTHFVLVKVTPLCRLFPIDSHGSADILSLANADAFMAVDRNLSIVKKKTKVQFITWKKL